MPASQELVFSSLKLSQREATNLTHLPKIIRISKFCENPALQRNATGQKWRVGVWVVSPVAAICAGNSNLWPFPTLLYEKAKNSYRLETAGAAFECSETFLRL